MTPYNDEWQGIQEKKETPPTFSHSKDRRKKARKHLVKLKKTMQLKCCKYCKSTDDLTIDHKIPLVKGGLNEKGNLQVLCSRCNSFKSDMSHKQVQKLFKWFNEVQQSRVAHGKSPYSLR